MTDPVVIHVHPLSEVRQRLSGILARFRREGAAAEPVAFGSHRKPEAILLPYEVYERYETLSRQRTRKATGGRSGPSSGSLSATSTPLPRSCEAIPNRCARCSTRS
jgi:hypothetical protein